MPGLYLCILQQVYVSSTEITESKAAVGELAGESSSEKQLTWKSVCVSDERFLALWVRSHVGLLQLCQAVLVGGRLLEGL